jgi:TadE-like protein
MRARRRALGPARGSASIELLGYMPFLLIMLVAGVQLAIAAFTAESAADAARAGARAVSKGNPAAVVVARQALSPGLRDDASFRPEGERFVVTVRIPSIIPGVSNDRWLLTRTATMPGGLL